VDAPTPSAGPTGQNLKGERLQGIPREDGRCLTKGAVAARFATSQVIIVHGRQVIMYQRIGVNQLNGTGSPVELVDS